MQKSEETDFRPVATPQHYPQDVPLNRPLIFVHRQVTNVDGVPEHNNTVCIVFLLMARDASCAAEFDPQFHVRLMHLFCRSHKPSYTSSSRSSNISFTKVSRFLFVDTRHPLAHITKDRSQLPLLCGKHAFEPALQSWLVGRRWVAGRFAGFVAVCGSAGLL